jgi:hypothetical protein
MVTRYNRHSLKAVSAIGNRPPRSDECHLVLAFKRDLLSHRFEHNFGTAVDPMQTWQGEEHTHNVCYPSSLPKTTATPLHLLDTAPNELSLKLPCKSSSMVHPDAKWPEHVSDRMEYGSEAIA